MNRPFDIVKIDISRLKYNVLNGRIAELDLESDIQLNEATYENIKNSIIKQSKSDIDTLGKSIAKEGLKEPLILNRHGVIVDGNRRYTAISMLLDGEIKPFSSIDIANLEFVEAVILDADSNEKSVKLLEYKIQFDDMKKSYDPISRAFDFARSFHRDKITVEQIAEATGIAKTEIEKDIRSVKLIRVYLAAIGKRDNISLAIDLKLDGPIKEIASSKEKTDYFVEHQQELVDILTVAKAEGGDVTRTVRDLVKGSKSTAQKHIMNSVEVKEKVSSLAKEINVDDFLQTTRQAESNKDIVKMFEKLSNNNAPKVYLELESLKVDLFSDQETIYTNKKIDDFLIFIKETNVSKIDEINKKKLKSIKDEIEKLIK